MDYLDFIDVATSYIVISAVCIVLIAALLVYEFKKNKSEESSSVEVEDVLPEVNDEPAVVVEEKPAKKPRKKRATKAVTQEVSTPVKKTRKKTTSKKS